MAACILVGCIHHDGRRPDAYTQTMEKSNMASRFFRQITAIAALAAGLALGGPHAEASLTLNIQHGGSVTNPAINIVNGTDTMTPNNGSFTFTGAKNVQYMLTIDGTVETFTTSGTTGSYTGTFTTTNVNQITFSDSTFGEFNISSLTATQGQSAQDSFIDDVNTDVTRNSNTDLRTLTIKTTTSFMQPSTTSVLLQSAVNLTTTDTNASTALSSAIGTGAPVSVTATMANPNPSAAAYVTPGTNPYTVTSQFTISNLGDGTATPISATIDARTDIFASPEPATLTMALMAVPATTLMLRRKRKAQA